MANNPKYYIVEASALPEVFLKVAEAKRLLSTGEAATVNEATKLTGISRSAFYKYRDAVLPFQNMMIGRIITFQLLLQDEKGVLSAILNLFAEVKANIELISRFPFEVLVSHGFDIRTYRGSASVAENIMLSSRNFGKGRIAACLVSGFSKARTEFQFAEPRKLLHEFFIGNHPAKTD